MPELGSLGSGVGGSPELGSLGSVVDGSPELVLLGSGLWVVVFLSWGPWALGSGRWFS